MRTLLFIREYKEYAPGPALPGVVRARSQRVADRHDDGRNHRHWKRHLPSDSRQESHAHPLRACDAPLHYPLGPLIGLTGGPYSLVKEHSALVKPLAA